MHCRMVRRICGTGDAASLNGAAEPPNGTHSLNGADRPLSGAAIRGAAAWWSRMVHSTHTGPPHDARRRTFRIAHLTP
jgi:hypothetical protein